jgi:hypothetical protein
MGTEVVYKKRKVVQKNIFFSPKKFPIVVEVKSTLHFKRLVKRVLELVLQVRKSSEVAESDEKKSIERKRRFMGWGNNNTGLGSLRLRGYDISGVK